MEEEREFNYGKLFNFFLDGKWTQKGYMGKEFKPGIGMCMCLSVAAFELYRGDEVIEVRKKLLDKIKEMFPERTSQFATRLAQVKEPLITDQYSIVAFNDHKDTDIDDVLLVCREAGV